MTSDEPEADPETIETTTRSQQVPMPERETNTPSANSPVDLQPETPTPSSVPIASPPPSTAVAPTTQGADADADVVSATSSVPSKEEEQLTCNLVCQGVQPCRRESRPPHLQ